MLCRGGDVGEGGEGVAVEVVGCFVPANVVGCDGDVDVAEVALGLAFWWGFDVVEWFGAVFWGFVEVELGGDGAAVDVGCVEGGDVGRGDCLSSCGHCKSVSGEDSSEVMLKQLWKGMGPVIVVDCEWSIGLVYGVKWELYKVAQWTRFHDHSVFLIPSRTSS